MKPDANQLAQALAQAERMREADDDPNYLSKSVIYLANRVEMLEKAVDLANQYMRFGQDEHLHAELLRALESAREQETTETRQDPESFGL